MDVLQFKEHSSIQGGNSFHPLPHFAQLSYFALFFAKWSFQLRNPLINMYKFLNNNKNLWDCFFLNWITLLQKQLTRIWKNVILYLWQWETFNSKVLYGIDLILLLQKQPPEAFCRKGVLRNFTKFTEKRLCQSLFLIKLQVSGLQLC